jgi:hypothetical protein
MNERPSRWDRVVRTMYATAAVLGSAAALVTAISQAPW